MIANIPQSKCSKQCIADNVKQHICITVAYGTMGMFYFDASQPKLLTRS
jgi:hypothetical protein